MRCRNREEAARLLAGQLAPYRGRKPLVLGVPRGAVPMVRLLAEPAQNFLLRADFLAKVAGVGEVEMPPFEHGDGSRIVVGPIASSGCPGARSLRTRTTSRSPPRAAGRIAIIVDDGVATGSSMLSAIRAVRAQGPRRVVAIGVAPPGSLPRVEAAADEVVCLHSTAAFMAVGRFFEEFPE